MRLRLLPRTTAVLLILLLSLAGSVVLPGNQVELVRAFTRNIEFDFIRWTVGALVSKLTQFSLGTQAYLSSQTSQQIVLGYLALVGNITGKENQLVDIYANPDITDPLTSSSELRNELHNLYAQRDQLQPLAEAIVQGQLSAVIAEVGLGLAGQTLPPVLFHTTSPPFALIVSPRDTIQQDANISISPELTLDQIMVLEEQVDASLNVSSLVERVGGIGLYPTMVMHTTDINWLLEVVAHEWVHNYLTLHPLGLNYLTSPQLRIINETVASIAGKELGQAVIARFYPDFIQEPRLPATTPSSNSQAIPQSTPEPPVFDFRAEMHTTRLTVDRLLSAGSIEMAENYMELRRRIFWENGYHIRKLNQAYFAFHGAYADMPGGAAGGTEDPVGSAVRALRANSESLAEFLHRIAWIWSFEQLQQAVERE